MTRAAADALVGEGSELLRTEQYDAAIARFEAAVKVFPRHPAAWKGLGHALLCLGRAAEATRAFDQAIGLAPTSATALWGGAIAHADVGNKMVAQNYLQRTLALQPTWIAMVAEVPQLQPFFRISVRAADLLRGVFGPFSCRTYRHAAEEGREIDVARLTDLPEHGQWTYLTVGFSDQTWGAAERPRLELVLASCVELELCGAVLANLAFHLGTTGFYPEPGTMVRDVVAALGTDLGHRLPHVYLQVPRAWGLHLPLDVGPPAITLAQVVPVSESEYQAWRQLGAARFATWFAERSVDVTNLRRAGT